MTYRVEIAQSAEQHLLSIEEWYRTQDPQVWLKLSELLKEALETLKTHPLSYPIEYASLRLITIKSFPYSIYYLVEKDVVKVLAILHQRRNAHEVLKNVE
jgi:plasmid stabilization system protein ParE